MAAIKTKILEESMTADDSDFQSFSFDPVEHKYTLDGKPLSGVTTVLGVIAKPMLIQWAATMAVESIKAEIYGRSLIPPKFQLDEIFARAKSAHRKKKEDAGTKGTEVHAMIEGEIKDAIGSNGGFMGIPINETVKRSNPQVQNFVDWAIREKVKFLASEKRMYSRSMWTAGTADIVCEIGGKMYVGDVKTSSGIYPEAFIQASAYAAMLEEMGDYKGFHGVIIINCRKDGGFETGTNYDLEGNLKCFKAALTLYRGLNSLKN